MVKALQKIEDNDLANELGTVPTGEDMISSSEETDSPSETIKTSKSGRTGLRGTLKKSGLHEPQPRQNADDYGYDDKGNKEPEEESDPTDIIDKDPDDEDDNTETSNEAEKIDEYGNEIVAKEEKMYPESEVNKMIRERLARGNHGQQPTAAEVATAKEQVNQTLDSDATEAEWERELSKVVDKIVTNKLQAKEQEQRQLQKQAEEIRWREQEAKIQAEFEDKFTSTMGKYSDFKTVVNDKPITDAIMIGIRGMPNPAAFLYAACKQQPQEIERISKIQDFPTQMLELGRLDEKIRKANNVTKSSRPISNHKGDVSDKFDELPKFDVDSAIEKDARAKLNQRYGKRSR